ncbi:MAG: heparinase II/III family protein [Thermodesulfobacteriota bacterium]
MRASSLGAHEFLTDSVPLREPLCGAADFASLPGAGLEADAVRFRAGSPLRVCLPVAWGDFSRFNGVVLVIRNCTARALLAGVRLFHGPEIGDPATPVSFSGDRELLPPGEWSELRFPAEGLGSYGSPACRNRIHAVEISVHREKFQSEPEQIEVLIRSLDGELREIPPGTRLTEQGLASVTENLSASHLSSRSRPVATIGTAGGERALMDSPIVPPAPNLKAVADSPLPLRGSHRDPRESPAMRSPASGNWEPFTASDPDFLVPPFHWYPKESPSDTLQGRIMGQELDLDSLWDADPHHAQEWRHFLHRHHFFRQLLLGFATTGDARYAVAVDRLVTSWMHAHPVPVGSNGGSSPAWETLSAAWRLREWLWIPGILWTSGLFRETTVAKMLCSIWEHARHLMDHQGHPTNWIVVESAALALAGMSFPWFREAPVWIETGVERLRNAFHTQFFRDGVHFEVSPLYHAICVHSYLEVRRTARVKGISLPTEFHEPLERCFEYLAALCRPDFTWVAFNDSAGIDTDLTALMGLAGEEFSRPDFSWIGARGRQEERTVPAQPGPQEHLWHEATMKHENLVPKTHELSAWPEASNVPRVLGKGSGGQPFCKRVSPGRFSWEPSVRAFSDAGIAVLRSGYHARANFLAFRGGCAGAGHVHGDVLSLDVAALGVSRLVDPGISTYSPDPLTDHYRSAAAHNTILIDGKGPERSGLHYSERIKPTGSDLATLSTRDLDLAMGRCRGPWSPEAKGIEVSRAVAFVRPDYWTVVDWVTGSGEHQISVCWQFAPGRVEIHLPTLTARCADLRGPSMELIPLNRGFGMQLEHAVGLLHPPRGWVSIAGGDYPAPSLRYTVTARAPAALVWVLFPYAGGPDSGVRASRSDHAHGSVSVGVRRRAGAAETILFPALGAKAPGEFLAEIEFLRAPE